MQPLPTIIPSANPQPAGVHWPTHEWPRATVVNQSELEAVANEAFSREDLSETYAVIVIRNGQILFERYSGEQRFFDRPAEATRADSALISWSMAKSMLHFLVGTLVDEGRLTVFQPAPVPEWSDPADPRHAITLADLLAMRDGLNFLEEYDFDSPSHVLEMLFPTPQPSVAAYVADLPLAHEPGTVFNYSSGTTNIISRIVADEVGYGEAYRRFLNERLFGPLGMSSAVPTFDDSGVFIASSYVHATAQDFAKFGLLYLRGGEWDGQQLVSRAWTETAQTPVSSDDDENVFYAWQWWLNGDEFGTYWANGYQGQMIAISPALDSIIVRLGRTDWQNYPELRAWRHRVLETLARSRSI
jgi:hypothetical protein